LEFLYFVHFFLKYERSTSCRALLLGDDMLARVQGLKRFAAKRYVGIAAGAKMVAKVSRHSCLVDCGFLSKCFVPRVIGFHAPIPLLGKALARFSTRANYNDAVTDHAYFAAKAIGYAYEFRFCPLIRDVFLDRFNYECPLALEEKHKLRFVESDGLTWSAKEAGVTLANIKTKLSVDREWLIDEEDLNSFCLHRYSLMGSEVVTLVEEVVLSLDVDADLSGYGYEVLALDFV